MSRFLRRNLNQNEALKFVVVVRKTTVLGVFRKHRMESYDDEEF
jgi:hypothetical protein